jgi:hypothetical protein
MLRLDATTRSLEVVLGGAVSTTEATFLTNWADGATTSYAGGATPGVTSGATPVTLVAAPGSGLIRDVDYVSVRNQDTAAITATVRYNDNTTIYPIIAVTLAVGDQLVYTHANGWSVFRLDGSVKSGTTGAQGDPGNDGSNGTNGVNGSNGAPGQDVVGGYDSFDEDGLALSYCGAGIAVAVAGGSGAWGGITGTLSDQTDLQTALTNLYAFAAANG